MFSPKIGRWLLAISFVPLYFLVQWLREYPEFIETYYSNTDLTNEYYEK